MLIAVRDDSDDTLEGAINGVNAVFKTSLPMRLDRVVEVLCNGLVREADLDNGYDLVDAFTIKLREVPEDGDTVMVRYFSEPQWPGVPNSQPEGVSTRTLQPASAQVSVPRPSILVSQPSRPSLSVTLTMR